MKFEAEKQDLQFVNSDKFDYILDFHKYVKNQEGTIDNNFKKYFPKLTLFEFVPSPTATPKIIYSGSLSSTREFFGQNWAENLPLTQAAPDPVLGKLAAPGYQQAAEEGFCCELVNTAIFTGSCMKNVEYLRYIATIETGSGHKFFALAGKTLSAIAY